MTPAVGGVAGCCFLWNDPSLVSVFCEAGGPSGDPRSTAWYPVGKWAQVSPRGRLWREAHILFWTTDSRQDGCLGKGPGMGVQNWVHSVTTEPMVTNYWCKLMQMAMTINN